MFGSSAVLTAFRQELERVAASDVTVLIEGENGSGKTLAARTLHALSPRSAGPLVEVHLAALAPSLLEAELFGHEEGAFTGAHRAREGRFRKAAGGTLVLDGVEQLDGAVQVKLLRALQERVIEPLGGEGSIPIDVRVVATSARDLREAALAGRFREDLYYRLAVVTLRVPPLRARRDDLGPLAHELARRLAKTSGAQPRGFSAEALARLAEHSWPGNVRELENLVERVMVLAPASSAGESGERPLVEPEEVAFLGEAVIGAERRIARDALAEGLTLERMGTAMMEEALSEHRGNLSAAARQVGLSRRAFEYRRAKAGEAENTEEEEATS